MANKTFAERVQEIVLRLFPWFEDTEPRRTSCEVYKLLLNYIKYSNTSAETLIVYYAISRHRWPTAQELMIALPAVADYGSESYLSGVLAVGGGVLTIARSYTTEMGPCNDPLIADLRKIRQLSALRGCLLPIQRYP